MKQKNTHRKYTHCKICKKKLGPGTGRDHRFGICHDHVYEQLTFKQYLYILDEDLAGDIAKLQSDISMIGTRINQQTKPLIDQKNRLIKMLAIKQKQKEAEDKRNNSTQNTSQQPRQSEMIAKSTSQPSPPQKI